MRTSGLYLPQFYKHVLSPTKRQNNLDHLFANKFWPLVHVTRHSDHHIFPKLQHLLSNASRQTMHHFYACFNKDNTPLPPNPPSVQVTKYSDFHRSLRITTHGRLLTRAAYQGMLQPGQYLTSHCLNIYALRTTSIIPVPKKSASTCLNDYHPKCPCQEML